MNSNSDEENVEGQQITTIRDELMKITNTQERDRSLQEYSQKVLRDQVKPEEALSILDLVRSPDSKSLLALRVIDSALKVGDMKIVLQALGHIENAEMRDLSITRILRQLPLQETSNVEEIESLVSGISNSAMRHVAQRMIARRLEERQSSQ